MGAWFLATAYSELLATQLAKLEGNAVVSSLHYANNEVNFNGQKMTVEQFIGFVMAKVGAVSGAQ